MKVNFEAAKDLYSQYADADRGMSDYYIDFPEDVNILDPLFLLERINNDSFSKKVEIVTALISGKKVEVWYQPPPVVGEDGVIKETFDSEKVMGFVFNGTGSIGALFTEQPFLLQVLMDYGYALVLKKLTPPSRGSKEARSKK
jgi:hypothetical protein